MFACLFQPSSQPSLFGLPADAGARREDEPATTGIEALAREFSPRVQVHQANLVSLDIAGLGRLLGTPAEIAEELQRTAERRGLRLHIAVAATRTAAMLLALAAPPPVLSRKSTVDSRGSEAESREWTVPSAESRKPSFAGSQIPPGAGSRKPEAVRRVPGAAVVVPPGGERDAVARLPLGVLRELPVNRLEPEVAGGQGRRGLAAAGGQLSAEEVVPLLRRWGLKTLGDLASLPSRPLSERLGQQGAIWQRLARGEDLQPLVANAPDVPIEETVDLEWPIEGLEPLSFVLARLCDPLVERLEALDLAAVGLHLSFRLASRETETRELQLPAPMRDPKVLRTLILLHLESHPLSGGVDRLSLRVDVAPGRVTQFSLLSRARPFPEQLATLLARLSALLGEDRVGAAALVDSHRPGAFAMVRFSGGSEKPDRGPEPPADAAPVVALRRFRVPVPARVIVSAGRPVRVATERQGLDGGAVTASAGPWRTSGDWWHTGSELEKWSRDEWDVGLSDGGMYRLYHDRSRDRWFVEGIVD
jgi:protein ImuB